MNTPVGDRRATIGNTAEVQGRPDPFADATRPPVSSVRTTDDLKAALAREMGGSLQGAHVAADFTRREQLIERSSLRGLGDNSHLVPNNWTGVESGPPQDVHDIRAIAAGRMDFAHSVEDCLKNGSARVTLRDGQSGIYEISFPKFCGGGTGEAAATLTSETLKVNGALGAITTDNQVLFMIASQDRPVMDALVASYRF